MREASAAENPFWSADYPHVKHRKCRSRFQPTLRVYLSSLNFAGGKDAPNCCTSVFSFHVAAACFGTRALVSPRPLLFSFIAERWIDGKSEQPQNVSLRFRETRSPAIPAAVSRNAKVIDLSNEPCLPGN